MNSKFGIAAIVVGFFVFTVGTARPANAAPPTNACSLLTPAQVSAVLGVPVAGKALGPNACIWVQTGVKPGSAKRRVNLILLGMPGYSGGYAVAKTPNALTTATHVSGLGDDAYYLSMTSGENMELRVKKGSVAFGILVPPSGTPFTPDQIKAKEKTLAVEICSKL